MYRVERPKFELGFSNSLEVYQQLDGFLLRIGSESFTKIHQSNIIAVLLTVVELYVLLSDYFAFDIYILHLSHHALYKSSCTFWLLLFNVCFTLNVKYEVKTYLASHLLNNLNEEMKRNNTYIHLSMWDVVSPN